MTKSYIIRVVHVLSTAEMRNKLFTILLCLDSFHAICPLPWAVFWLNSSQFLWSMLVNTLFTLQSIHKIILSIWSYISLRLHLIILHQIMAKRCNFILKEFSPSMLQPNFLSKFSLILQVLADRLSNAH